MAKNYYGDDGVDIVNQNNNHPYYNIYTYGGDDEVTLTLTSTYVDAAKGDDTVTSKIEGNNDIKLGDGDDTYIGKGFSHSNRYDQVFGNGGNDTFTVATAISDYYGDSGKDRFESAGYWNYFNGGDGNDTISYMRQDSDVLRGTGVRINLSEEYATTGDHREETLVNIENAEGTSYDDTIGGSAQKNKLWGMNGQDVLYGNKGNDVLYGGNQGDNLHGDTGNDKLIGGKGVDLLEGGSGADTFIFQSINDSKVGSDRDVIDDFSRSEHDKIDVSAIDAISGGGDDAFTFIGTAAFSGTAGELRFKNEILSGDVDGDGKADFQVKVDDFNTLQASDFIL